jgi:hypothetical protein
MPTSETATTEATEATVTEATGAAEATTETVPDYAAEAAKWKALARKHEEQSKANADKAKRLDALEEASKTELEKVTARAEAAEKAAAESALKALRADVASAKGVPAALLSGSSQEELEAAADALLAFKGTTPRAPSADGQGNVGGPVGTGEGQITSVEELKKLSPADQLKARRDGRLKTLLGS